MSLEVVRAGLLDTIQDGGRFGYQHLGINPNGVMDKLAMHIANALVGNAYNEAVIEMAFPAAIFIFNNACLIALSGADFGATINGRSIPINHPIAIPSKSELKFTKNNSSSFSYLAVQHGFEIQQWLNSASTNLKATVGGCKGSALKKGDFISFKQNRFTFSEASVFPWSPIVSFYNEPQLIHCIKGVEFDWLAKTSQKKLLKNSFVIITRSDRMGYCFQSEALVKLKDTELLSTAVQFGTVQLLPSGQLICLMADHQTTGGYPRVAQVIQSDLPKLAQRKPNESITFKFVSLKEAEDRLVKQFQQLQQIQTSCRLHLNQFLSENYKHRLEL